MTDVYLKLPFGLVAVDGARRIICRGHTVSDALDDACIRDARLATLVSHPRDRLRVTVLLNGWDIVELRGWETPLADGDRLSLVPRTSLPWRDCPY